jgi:HlyD family secretion protein
MLLACGLGSTFAAKDLSEPNDEDKAKANADFAPANPIDVRAPLPIDGAVGGAGLIEPKDRPVSLSAEVSGVVDAVSVVEGQQVQAGDLLLSLRAGPVRADLEAAEADERAARGATSPRPAPTPTPRRPASASSTETARRNQALFDKGVASADERDRAARTAESDQQAARAASSRADQARSRLAAATARKLQAEQRLAQLEIRAPSAGEVLQVLVRPGESVSPGAAAVVVGDTQKLRARLDIDERDAVGVKAGRAARVRIEGMTAEYAATVVDVGRRVGRKNVRTDDPTDRLDARFVEVVVELDEVPEVPIGIRVNGYLLPEGPKVQ